MTATSCSSGPAICVCVCVCVCCSVERNSVRVFSGGVSFAASRLERGCG